MTGEEIGNVSVFHVIHRSWDVVWHLIICLAVGVYDWTDIKSNVQKDKLEETKNDCQGNPRRLYTKTNYLLVGFTRY